MVDLAVDFIDHLVLRGDGSILGFDLLLKLSFRVSQLFGGFLFEFELLRHLCLLLFEGEVGSLELLVLLDGLLDVTILQFIDLAGQSLQGGMILLDGF